MKSSPATLYERPKSTHATYHRECLSGHPPPQFESDSLHGYEHRHVKSPMQQLNFHKQEVHLTPISLPSPPAAPEFFGRSLRKWYQKKPLLTLTAKGQVKRMEKYLKNQKTLEICKREYQVQAETQRLKETYIDFQYKALQPLLFESKELCCICPCNASRNYDMEFIPVEHRTCNICRLKEHIPEDIPCWESNYNFQYPEPPEDSQLNKVPKYPSPRTSLSSEQKVDDLSHGEVTKVKGHRTSFSDEPMVKPIELYISNQEEEESLLENEVDLKEETDEENAAQLEERKMNEEYIKYGSNIRIVSDRDLRQKKSVEQSIIPMKRTAGNKRPDANRRYSISMRKSSTATLEEETSSKNREEEKKKSSSEVDVILPDGDKTLITQGVLKSSSSKVLPQSEFLGHSTSERTISPTKLYQEIHQTSSMQNKFKTEGKRNSSNAEEEDFGKFIETKGEEIKPITPINEEFILPTKITSEQRQASFRQMKRKSVAITETMVDAKEKTLTPNISSSYQNKYVTKKRLSSDIPDVDLTQFMENDNFNKVEKGIEVNEDKITAIKVISKDKLATAPPKGKKQSVVEEAIVPKVVVNEGELDDRGIYKVVMKTREARPPNAKYIMKVYEDDSDDDQYVGAETSFFLKRPPSISKHYMSRFNFDSNSNTFIFDNINVNEAGYHSKKNVKYTH